MTSDQLLLLCLVDPGDARDLAAALPAVGCEAVMPLGNGGREQAQAGLLIVASPGEVSLVLAMVRRLCARRLVAAIGDKTTALAILLNPLGEQFGGATVLALPVRNAVRWALGDLPAARGAARGWMVLDGTVIEQELLPSACTMPTKLLFAVVPDQAADRVIAALAARRFHAMIVGSTGGFFRRGNTTIVADVPAAQAQSAAEVIRSACVAGHEQDAPEQGIAFALDVAWQVRF